ncbi:MAG: tol-pal system protein YbgF [Gallionellales bacterium GWA2_59_43]|nr:MAG: tol-pal system protein YbgF [Gallionellales bacterium GWA2_59_43]
MLKQRALLLLALCCAGPAYAGLFSDDEARKQIQQLEARLDERLLKLESAAEQQTRSMLDLQSQIEALNAELRTLRGQNEELARGLQDAEKREKDFYVDLDTRLRVLESAASSEQEQAAAAAAAPADPDDPAQENRAYEAAYALFKAGDHLAAIKSFQEFSKKHPASVHAPNAYYWQGNAQLAMKNHKAALETYRNLRKEYPAYPRDADVLLGIAECQSALKQSDAAKKTLKLLVTKYPDSEAAAKAKKQLAAAK